MPLGSLRGGVELFRFAIRANVGPTEGREPEHESSIPSFGCSSWFDLGGVLQQPTLKGRQTGFFQAPPAVCAVMTAV